MPMLEISLVTALAAQVPLLALAFLVEFSQRKKRPSRSVEDQAERTPSERSAAQPAHREPTLRRPEPSLETMPEATPVEAAGNSPEAAAEPSIGEPAPVLEASLEEPALLVTVPAEPPVTVPAEPPTEAFIAVPAAPAPVEVQQPEAIAVPEQAAAPPPLPALSEVLPEPARIGLGLRKTRENFIARIRAAISGSAKAEEIYESLEEALIGADTGVETSLKIVEAVRGKLKNDARPEVIRNALKEEIERILITAERPLADSGDAPLVIMMAGVNGAGKTTTVAKLAALFKRERGLVVVAAADTFRAAAIEQLQLWCDRVGVDLIKQKQGSDPAAVAFDAVKAAVARKASALLIDTAGRLQTKVNLMEELKKVARVVGRELPGAPHETWLVLDANTGQNALSQAKQFGETVPLTGVILAKLDSTAKGGVIIGIAERLKLPVRFVGLGENLEDLRAFDAREFAEALFAESNNGSAKSYAA